MPEFSGRDVQFEEIVRFHEVPTSAGIEAQNEFLSEIFDKLCNEKFGRPGPLWSLDVADRYVDRHWPHPGSWRPCTSRCS